MNHDEPSTAAAFFLGAREAPEPAFDSWPPFGWFVGTEEADANGNHFDWSAPPVNFTVECAYLWVDQVGLLYRHLEACDWAWYRANGVSASALTNAYLLVDDLQRRGLVPLSGLRRYRVEMNEYVPGFEVRALGEIREWLGAAVERNCRRARGNAAKEKRDEARRAELQRQAEAAAAARELAERRLSADYKNGTVTLGTVCHPVGDIRAAFVHVLLNSGDWVSLKTIGSEIGKILGFPVRNLTRERKKLPPSVRAAIEINKQFGHRIRPAYRK